MLQICAITLVAYPKWEDPSKVLDCQERDRVLNLCHCSQGCNFSVSVQCQEENPEISGFKEEQSAFLSQGVLK